MILKWTLLLITAIFLSIINITIGVDFSSGLIITGICTFLAWPLVTKHNFFRTIYKTIRFIFYYIGELIKANLHVAYHVLKGSRSTNPGVIALPLDASTDFEITLLANLITLTPGTLSLDVTDDKKVLYVHTLYIDDADKVRRELKNGLEYRLLEVLR